MAALHRFGGWATDLDVLGIRPVRDWPDKDGYAFALSPQRQDTLKSKHVEMSLSIVRMPRGAAEASLLQIAFTDTATAHARSVASGKRSPCEWTARQCTAAAGWLANQKTLYNVVMTSPHLKRQCSARMCLFHFPSGCSNGPARAVSSRWWQASLATKLRRRSPQQRITLCRQRSQQAAAAGATSAQSNRSSAAQSHARNRAVDESCASGRAARVPGRQ